MQGEHETMTQTTPTIIQLIESQNREPIGLVLIHDETSIEKTQKLLDEYRDNTPDYNNEDFINHLEERGIDAELINPTAVNF